MKSFVVIGVGRFGSGCDRAYKMGHEVLAIDEREEFISRIADHVTHRSWETQRRVGDPLARRAEF
jgi:trk system potassium uptake protein TrkA